VRALNVYQVVALSKQAGAAANATASASYQSLHLGLTWRRCQ
jgi:hypothetical protein